MAQTPQNNGAVTPSDSNAARAVNPSTMRDLTASAILDESLKELGVDGSDPVEPSEVDDTANEEVEDDAADESGSTDATPPGADSEGEKDADDDETADADSAPDTEEIVANGETVTIDYSDRAAIKRAHEKAAGVDKLFGRYKQLRDEKKAGEAAAAATAEKVALYDTLTASFGDGGVDGTRALIDRLTGGKAKEYAKQIAAAADAPAPTAEQTAEAHKSEAAKLREEVAALKDETRRERAQAIVDGVYPKYSFKGKFGDAVAEEKLDSLIFSEFQALWRTEEQKGTQMTAPVIEQLLKKAGKAVPEAVHQAARQLATQKSGKTAKAAKAAAQKAAIGGGSSSKRGTQMTADDSNVNWLNPSEVTNFLEASLNNRK